MAEPPVSGVSKVVVSYGAGTNSTAMICEMVRRGEPIDATVFADTGGERPDTYQHLHEFSDWLVAHGYPAIVVVANDGMHGTLEAECLTNHRLPSIAYGFSTCSDKYKRRPFKKWLKAQQWSDVTVCIGFDADEPHRADKGGAASDPYEKRYPLIEWDMGREECIEAIRAAGITPPGKSACFFCPSSKRREVLGLQRAYPELMERAMRMEAGAELTSLKGLGRKWSWTELVQADEAQMDLFDGTLDAPCGCYDG